MQPDRSPGLLLVLTLNSVFFLQSQAKGEELILSLSRYFFLKIFIFNFNSVYMCVYASECSRRPKKKVLNP